MKYILPIGFIVICLMVHFGSKITNKMEQRDQRMVYLSCLYGYNTASQTDTKKAGQVCKNLVKLVYGESNEKINPTP